MRNYLKCNLDYLGSFTSLILPVSEHDVSVHAGLPTLKLNRLKRVTFSVGIWHGRHVALTLAGVHLFEHSGASGCTTNRRVKGGKVLPSIQQLKLGLLRAEK